MDLSLLLAPRTRGKGAQWRVTSRAHGLHAWMSVALALGVLLIVGSAGPAEATGGGSSLKVTVTWAPGLTDTWSLQCDPVGGNHPNRARACDLLNGLATPFSTTPTGMACSMIYAGPERARVTGRWRGGPVDARFARNDGCAAAKWRTYQALFTEPGVVTVRGRVDLGPTCPVQRPDENCTIVGAPATVTATSGARHRIATSGADGFALRLPRARWKFTADAGMHCPSVDVDAHRGQLPPPMVISCDTGIR
jgi:hypothetical protein